MAGGKHEFTGVSGKITVNGTIVGFVSGDVTLEKETGKYIEVGSDVAEHTRGKRTVSGTLKKAWGIADSDLYDLFENDTVFDILLDADSGATHTYTASGCMLTSLAIEGLEAGSEEALIINASFEGRTWTRAV